MRFIKAISVAAVLVAGAGVAMASPFDANSSLQSLDEASYATVLTVNAGEARSLAIDVDTASLQARIKNNSAISRAVESQGFAVDQIVGIDSTNDGASVTLYAL